MLVMMEDGLDKTDTPGCEPLPERAAKRTHLRMLPGSCAVFTPLTPSQSAPPCDWARLDCCLPLLTVIRLHT